MSKRFIISIIILITIIVIFSYSKFFHKEPLMKVYTSVTYGISFLYPENYFIQEIDSKTKERVQHTIVLLEDISENHALIAGEQPGREAPPTITISFYQNNLDNYTTENFVRNTNFSNFKLSDGVITPVTLDGKDALGYSATGLYENKNVVIAKSAYVYMFTGFYNSPSDQILSDFNNMLKTVKFNN